MGGRERAAVPLPAAAMVLSAAPVLLLALAALVSSQGQTPLGKPPRRAPEPRGQEDPREAEGRGSLVFGGSSRGRATRRTPAAGQRLRKDVGVRGPPAAA